MFQMATIAAMTPANVTQPLRNRVVSNEMPSQLLVRPLCEPQM
jgi:hypothetical protein